MVTASPFAVAVADLWAALSAIELLNFLNPQPCAGTTTSTPTPPLDTAVLLPLAAAVALVAAVGLIYRHLHRATPAAAGAGARLSSELLAFMCAAAGLLEFILFVQPAGGVDGGALATAAVDALPAAATATFFLGMTLIIAHIRAGGEDGGGGAVAGNPPVPTPGVELLRKMSLGAAAVLVCLMAMSLCAKC